MLSKTFPTMDFLSINRSVNKSEKNIKVIINQSDNPDKGDSTVQQDDEKSEGSVVGEHLVVKVYETLGKRKMGL